VATSVFVSTDLQHALTSYLALPASKQEGRMYLYLGSGHKANLARCPIANKLLGSLVDGAAKRLNR
jgi:hypothetical protein